MEATCFITSVVTFCNDLRSMQCDLKQIVMFTESCIRNKLEASTAFCLHFFRGGGGEGGDGGRGLFII